MNTKKELKEILTSEKPTDQMLKDIELIKAKRKCLHQLKDINALLDIFNAMVQNEIQLIEDMQKIFVEG